MADTRFDVFRGTTFRASLRPEHSDGSGEYTPEDLTGCTTSFGITEPGLRNVITHSNPAIVDGWIELTLSADETQRFSPGISYFGALNLIHPSGDVERILTATFRFTT